MGSFTVYGSLQCIELVETCFAHDVVTAHDLAENRIAAAERVVIGFRHRIAADGVHGHCAS
jgi:hypothetical protein